MHGEVLQGGHRLQLVVVVAKSAVRGYRVPIVLGRTNELWSKGPSV
jgi:hypothetical protein